MEVPLLAMNSVMMSGLAACTREVRSARPMKKQKTTLDIRRMGCSPAILRVCRSSAILLCRRGQVSLHSKSQRATQNARPLIRIFCYGIQPAAPPPEADHEDTKGTRTVGW